MLLRRFLRGVLPAVIVLSLAVSVPVPALAQRAPADAGAPPGPFAEFVAALRKGDTNGAFAVLDKLPEDHPAFLQTLCDAAQVLAGNGWAARGVPYAQRAYGKAPDDMQVVHAFMRVQLLARTNLSEPIVPRARAATIPTEFRFITDTPKFSDGSKTVSRRRLLADLDFLELVLANAYSYAERRGADWRGALDALRASLGERTPINTFALRLRRFFTLFGDPHTAARGRSPRSTNEGGAPFLPFPDSDRVLGLNPEGSGFLDDPCRYIDAIDGVGISEWLRVAGFDVPKASPQWARRQTVASLERLNDLRMELGLPTGTDVRLALTSADRSRRREITLKVAAKPPRPVRWPRGDTRRLDGELGYLRIPSMDPEPPFLAKLDEAMARFRDTRGLVIDVRGNGGGSQDALRTLLPYFLQPGAPMKIVNVAAYRLPVRLPRPCAEGYLGLSGRGLYPVTSRTWRPEQRVQIREFLRDFNPSWKLPPGKFSDWHVMGISGAANPKAFHYTNRVVVLMDAGCFSATDNFLGALKGLANVTLLGTSSGGGSGRMTRFTLPETRIPLTVCQMASYRANGDLFDGRGVDPDVVVEPKPEDFLTGGGDAVLEAALARLRGGR